MHVALSIDTHCAAAMDLQVSGALECNMAWCALHLGDLDEAMRLASEVSASPSANSGICVRAE
jgi:hypothetical protein